MSLQFVFVLSDSANDRKGDTGLCGCATRFMVSPRGCLLSVSSSEKSPSRAGGVFALLVQPTISLFPLVRSTCRVAPLCLFQSPKRGAGRVHPSRNSAPWHRSKLGDLLHMQRLPVHHLHCLPHLHWGRQAGAPLPSKNPDSVWVRMGETMARCKTSCWHTNLGFVLLGIGSWGKKARKMCLFIFTLGSGSFNVANSAAGHLRAVFFSPCWSYREDS